MATDSLHQESLPAVALQSVDWSPAEKRRVKTLFSINNPIVAHLCGKPTVGNLDKEDFLHKVLVYNLFIQFHFYNGLLRKNLLRH